MTEKSYRELESGYNEDLRTLSLNPGLGISDLLDRIYMAVVFDNRTLASIVECENDVNVVLE